MVETRQRRKRHVEDLPDQARASEARGPRRGVSHVLGPLDVEHGGVGAEGVEGREGVEVVGE